MKNTYTLMLKHLEDNVYKRGKNKGEAPAFERNKDYLRVINRGTHMAFMMHRTDVISAYPDGKVVLDFGHHHESSTTRRYFSKATSAFCAFRGYASSKRINDYGNTSLRLYYPGHGKLIVETALTGQPVTLQESAEGTIHIVDGAKPFKRYKADVAKNKRMAELLAPVKALMPLLWDTERDVQHGYFNWASCVASACQWEQPIDPAEIPALVYAMRSAVTTSGWDYALRRRVLTVPEWRVGWSRITKHIAVCNRLVVEEPAC